MGELKGNILGDLTFEDFALYIPDFVKNNSEMTRFFREAFRIVNGKTDTSVVSAIVDRCGIGKSNFIHSLMNCSVSEAYFKKRKTPIGMVIITDSIKRLEEIGTVSKRDWETLLHIKAADDHFERLKNQIALIKMRRNKSSKQQLLEQRDKSIVMLSTQRYFMLDPEEREELFFFEYEGQVLPRRAVFFDERPLFYDIVTIDPKVLTDILGALQKGLPDTVSDKKYLVEEFKGFINRMFANWNELESTSDSSITTFWKDRHYNTITNNDDLLFQTVKKYIVSLTNVNNSILKQLKATQELMINGGVMILKKRDDKDGYDQSARVLIDNTDCFYLGGERKFFVFDATAGIDPRYNVRYVRYEKMSRCEAPIHLSIMNINITSSLTCFNNDDNELHIKAIKEDMQERVDIRGIDKNEVLVVTYKDYVEKFEDEYINTGYYGNIKGINDYRNFKYMSHVGLHRYDPLTYFFMASVSNKTKYKQIARMKEKDRRKFFDSIFHSSGKGTIFEEPMQEVMLNSLLMEFEQTIFRLCIRNVDNQEEAEVWAYFYRSTADYKKLIEMMRERYEKYGVKIILENAPKSYRIAKSENRKLPEGKEISYVNIVRKWIRDFLQLPEIKIVKRASIIENTGLKPKQFEKIVENNEDIRNALHQMSVNAGKKGYYQNRKR